MIENILFILLLFFNLLFLLIIIYNYFTAPVIKNIKSPINDSKKLSILIPARNEEKNISHCLDSIVNQSFTNYEIIVLDDESIDNTANIVNTYVAKDSRIKLEQGKKLPEGWLGKNWACFQLSQKASGDLFLFIDADVRLNENAVSNSIKLREEKSLNLITVFPTQQINGIGAQLVVPLMNWLLLTFLPLKKVYTSRRSSFVAANGQFILIDRKTYVTIGGHSSVRNQVVEDMELAKKVKKNGLRMLTALGGDSIFCKMYNSLNDSVNGFSKNFYKGFNISALTFLFMLFFVMILFFSPVILIMLNINFLLIVTIILIGRVLISLMSKQKVIINIILHFLQMLVLIIVGIKSVYAASSGDIEWKGRKI